MTNPTPSWNSGPPQIAHRLKDIMVTLNELMTAMAAQEREKAERLVQMHRMQKFTGAKNRNK